MGMGKNGAGPMPIRAHFGSYHSKLFKTAKICMGINGAPPPQRWLQISLMLRCRRAILHMEEPRRGFYSKEDIQKRQRDRRHVQRKQNVRIDNFSELKANYLLPSFVFYVINHVNYRSKLCSLDISRLHFINSPLKRYSRMKR